MGKMIHAAIVLMLAAGPVAAQADEADLVKGEKVYKKCKICHEVAKEKNKLGPHLVNLFGRKAGSLESFKKYSPAMKAKAAEGLVWDAATLNEYLTKPKAFIPKGKMPFPGLKAEADRTNLIGYLEKATKPAQ